MNFKTLGKMLVLVLFLLFPSTDLVLANEDKVEFFYAEKVTTWPGIETAENFLANRTKSPEKKGKEPDRHADGSRAEMENKIQKISSDMEKAKKVVVHFSSDKIREDSFNDLLSGEITTLYLKNENKRILIYHGKESYLEVDLYGSWPGILSGDGVEKIKQGIEEVNGYECTKYSVSRSLDLLVKGMTLKWLSWESDRLPMPLRTDDPRFRTLRLL